MNAALKPVEEQTIVITGASSGIGLVTARMAAARGARLVLAARSGGALDQLAAEINGAGRLAGGPQAVAVETDVSREADVRALAARAVEAFGGFDTWVNNAAVSIYGRVEETPVEDMRRQFDVNVWGVVYGSLEAVRHLRAKGGALINVGSVLSDRAIPLQGSYCASKHAVKGFTDALRMELEDEGAPVSVTLVKPAAINTPYPRHAKNFLDTEPQHVAPVYAPEAVARAVLHAAERPVRDVFVGGGAKGTAALGYYAPRAADRYMESSMIPGMQSDRPPRPREDNALDRPMGALEERGGYPGHTMETSAYTQAVLHPGLVAAAVVGLGLAVQALRRP